jgi:predicted nucleic-acid-binding protein
VKVAVDTNVLVRGAVLDDRKQARIADKLLQEASLVAVSLPCLCEFVWVLRHAQARWQLSEFVQIAGHGD